MNKSLVIIFATVALDAAGIGIIFPILPSLLKDVTHSDAVSLYMGGMTALYAVMQFIFAPLLGALSDRLGRRPVLLLSMAGAVVSYLFLAFSPNLALLLFGRMIAGLTSANMSVASAYITDITPEAMRARRFGLFNAMFGAGFIVGPILGGVLGDYWVRLPFIAAAALNGCNFLLALLALPESRTPGAKPLHWRELNPLRPLLSAFDTRKLLPMVLTFFILSSTGEAYGIGWALWGHDTFLWNGFWIGLSLGLFGVFQTLVQAFLVGWAATRFGERGAVFVGIFCSCLALLGLAFANQSWEVFVLMPLLALGGIGTPALQALATKQVDANEQGQLQGVLMSAVSLASIVAPLLFSSVYYAVQASWPGAIWLAVVLVYLSAIPFVVWSTHAAR